MLATKPPVDRAYDLGPVEQIPLGEGREVHVCGRRVAIFRTRAGEVFAAQAECPHRGGPLADGLIGGRTILCPLHEFKFNLADGAPIGNECPALRTFKVHIDERGHLLIGACWARSDGTTQDAHGRTLVDG